MNFKKFVALGLAVVTGAALAGTSYAQTLFSEDFDDGNASTRWTANNPGSATFDGISPMDTNYDLDADGVTDDVSGFSFDYSTIGIPAAPNSAGTTVGMKMQANLFFGAFGGFSLSPNGQSFTGDYVLKFDMWQNFNGPLDTGFQGTTNLAYGGILSDGMTPNMAGIVDGVFFAATPDGDSGADYRAYSFERQISYQEPPITDPTSPSFCDGCDEHATYFAGSRNNSADLYRLNINPDVGGGLGATTAPQAQLDLFPQQMGNLRAGAMGFAWHRHEIEKVGDVITWSVNGLDLIEVDLTEVEEEPGGDNIFFGYADTGAASSTDPNAQFLLFAVVDNVVVEEISGQVDNADFNGDQTVDGEDFLIWQRGFGTPDAQLADGDANGDNAVDAADLQIWQGQYPTPLQISATAVPEPNSFVALVYYGLMALLGYRPCRSRVRA